MVESTNLTNNAHAFSVSLLTPWIKGEMKIDNHFLKIDLPNTILFGLIPAGKSKDSSPLSSISNIYTSSSYKLVNIFSGILVVFLGLLLLGDRHSNFIVTFLVILLGIVLIGSGIKTTLCYERQGIAKKIDFPFFEANHVQEFSEQIESQLTNYQDDRNFRVQLNNQSQQSVAQPTSQTANIFCSSCGTPATLEQKFCPSCGAKLHN